MMKLVERQQEVDPLWIGLWKGPISVLDDKRSVRAWGSAFVPAKIAEQVRRVAGRSDGVVDLWIAS